MGAWLKELWTNPITAKSFFRTLLFAGGQALATGQIPGVPAYVGPLVSAAALLVSSGDRNLSEDQLQEEINKGIAAAAAKAAQAGGGVK